MAKKFTALSLAALKPEPTRYEIGDIEPGLYIRVTPTGAKSFVVRYKYLGKVRRLTLGSTDDLSLSDARDLSRDAMKKARSGNNPASEKQEIKASKIREEIERKQEEVNLIEKAIEAYIELHVANLASRREVERMLRYDVISRWKGRDIRSITKSDVLTLLKNIKARGASTMANRILANLRAFFNWAISVDYAGLTYSPCQGVKAPAPETRRDRVLSDDELRLILRATKKMDKPWGEFFRLLILTGVRRGEAGDAVWSEFSQFENEKPHRKPEWLIPGTRTKNSRPHLLPLPDMVTDLLSEIDTIYNCEYVFSVTGNTPLAGYSDAKERLEAQIIEDLNDPDVTKMEPWRIHDIRRTVATGMAGLGVPPHVVEAVLNHVSGAMAGVAGIYNRHNYYEEKKQALNLWADHIAMLEGSRPRASNVVSLR